MELYVEKQTPGSYGLIDTFIDETVTLNTKTTYVQDITAVFKGFTNDFSIDATPNNIKLLDYFGYTEQLQPASIKKRAKLYLDGSLYKEGIITLKDTAWVNGRPQLFSIEFSDGKVNLTELLGEDTLAMLNDGDGDITWDTKTIQKALQTIQSATGGIRWFIPLVSDSRIFSLSNSTEIPATDNIVYSPSKPIDSENVLLPSEIHPAMFMEDILAKVNEKYDIKIDPTKYNGKYSQLTGLATMCTSELSIKEVKADVTDTVWFRDDFREERFDVIIKPKSSSAVNGFELNYIGYGAGSSHNATFDMIINLCKIPPIVKNKPFSVSPYVTNESLANASYVDKLEVWEVNADGSKKSKLNYSVTEGSERLSSYLRIRIGLDVFYPEGGNTPSTLVKPLIAVFVTASDLSDWKYTYFGFNWNTENWTKFIKTNVQSITQPTKVNLFDSLSSMKVIDFVKSIYTMFGYKKFGDEVLNDFYYIPKSIGTESHIAFRNTNDLTPYADLSKVPKKTNTFYDGYDLKHATSEYQQNVVFLSNNGLEYGQLKFPLTGKPKSEFKIETKFTAPVFNPVLSDLDELLFTFYPFGSEPKLNDIETRFVYDKNTKEFPIFYYNGVKFLSTSYAYLDTVSKTLKPINKYHEISHKSSTIRTGTDNYITSIFNTLVGADFIDQNTLYAQGYKNYIEDTLSGKKLIHTIDLRLPNKKVLEFRDNEEIVIKETRYTVMESSIPLTGGTTKLTLLNK